MTAAWRKPARKRSSRLPRQQFTEPSQRGHPRKTYFELSPLELECMKVLWALREASVREIRARLSAQRRPLAYTTVETIMDRLACKGAVTRRKQGKAHRYTPLYQKSAARAQGVAALVEHFFDGSRQALRAYLAGQPVPDGAALDRPPSPIQQPGRAPVRGASSSPRPPREPRRPSVRSRGRVAPAEPPLETSLL